MVEYSFPVYGSFGLVVPGHAYNYRGKALVASMYSAGQVRRRRERLSFVGRAG